MSLRLDNVTKSFDGKVILDNFSYDFDSHGIYVVWGKSGIGKTTLLRIISGLDKNYSGIITDGGTKNVSMSFQEYRLFPALSALDNVAVACFDKPAKTDYEKSAIMLSKLGFSSDDMKLKPKELSGGMKQRVSLARAFLLNRPILLLDEATKELDANHARQVLNIIKDLSETRLVILVTHSESDVFYLSPKEIINL